MRIEIVTVCLGAALNLTLWGALYNKLRALPLDVWKVAQRNRVADETRALDVLQAAAASRLGGLLIGVRTYHEQLGGLVRAQLAEAEVRARVSERRASEAGAALGEASALVRDLRALAEDLPSLLDRRALQTGIAIGEASARRGATEPAPETLRGSGRPRPLTVPVEAADEDAVSGDEELTVVQGHHLAQGGAS